MILVRYSITVVILIHTSKGFTQSTKYEMDKYFLKKMRKANILGMQAAYISDGELEWIGSYGKMNYSTKQSVNDSTLFMIASCSKPVTALGIMKLVDQNKLNLDTDINEYLPVSIRNPHFPEKPITTRMLLTHTSSLKDQMDTLLSLYTFEKGGDSQITIEDFIEDYFLTNGRYYNADQNFTNYPPGEKKDYCNVGYALAGYIIQEVTNKSFQQFMSDEIFAPLSMKKSSWYLTGIMHNNISQPHEYVPGASSNSRYKVLNHYGYPTIADGQLRTNVSDYAQVIKLMINQGVIDGERFLKKRTVDTFLRIQFPNIDKWQALSWNYNEFNNWLYYLLMPRYPSHTGVDPGVATVTSFDPESKTGAIIFSNTLTTSFRGHKIFYQEMIKRLMKEANR